MFVPPRRSAAAVIAASASLLLAACGSSTNGFGTGSSGPTPTASSTRTSSVPGTAGKTVTVTDTASGGSASASAPDGTTTSGSSPEPTPVSTANITPAGKAPIVLKIWGRSDVTDCAAHAYGTPVLRYLAKHSCRGIHRVLASTTVNGRAVGIAAETVNWAGKSVDAAYRAAGGFASLVTKDGTGNVSDLIREGVRIPGGPSQLPYPDTFFAGAQDNGTLIYEAFYLKGSTPPNDPALKALIQDIVLQI